MYVFKTYVKNVHDYKHYFVRRKMSKRKLLFSFFIGPQKCFHTSSTKIVRCAKNKFYLARRIYKIY